MAMGGDRGIFTTQGFAVVFLSHGFFRPTPRIIHYFIATVCYLDFWSFVIIFFLRGGILPNVYCKMSCVWFDAFFFVCRGGWKRVGQRINFSEARPCLHQHKIPALSSASIWQSLGRIGVDLGNLKFPKSGVFFLGCLVMCCENVFQIQDALSHLRWFHRN